MDLTNLFTNPMQLIVNIGVVIIKWTRKIRENEKGHNYDKKALFKRI